MVIFTDGRVLMSYFFLNFFNLGFLPRLVCNTRREFFVDFVEVGRGKRNDESCCSYRFIIAIVSGVHVKCFVLDKKLDTGCLYLCVNSFMSWITVIPLCRVNGFVC